MAKQSGAVGKRNFDGVFQPAQEVIEHLTPETAPEAGPVQPAGAIRTLALGAFKDQVLSADGSILYASTGSGIMAYAVADGTLIGNWAVGSQLGGIDLSPNGRFIVATEWQNGPTVFTGPSSSTTEYYVRVLDTVTGTVATYTSLEGPYQSYFYDASFLADGRILLTQESVGSAQQPLTILDPATGLFTDGNVGLAQAGVMTATADRSTILITGKNSSGGPTLIYEAGVGVVATRNFSTNTGVQAISNDGSLIAEDRQILNDHLQPVENLVYHPFNASGSVFSPAGDALYYLDASAALVFKVRTSDWTVIGGYPVGTAVHPRGSGFGNELALTPDGRFLTVLGTSGIQVIDLGTALSEVGTAGDDILTGDNTANYLYGFGGDDILDGGGNPASGQGDIMYGGTGNDTYYVDAYNDLAIETGYSDGYDTVYSSITYSLPGGIERLILTGSAQYGSGSGTIIGNDFDNGLQGSFSNDVLIGNGGNDYLNGGSGIDEMRGGPGNDTYELDNALDFVIEQPNQGTDTVYVSFDYTLPDNFENLYLTVYGGQHGIGNAADNRLIGERRNDHLEGLEGNDFLDGMAGANTLEGGQGNDIYVANSASETLIELADEGIDEVQTNLASYTLGNNFENLRGTRLTAQQLFGNLLSNTIWGGNGNDTLTGGVGSDQLFGGFGNDTLVSDPADLRIDGGAGTDKAVFAESGTLVGQFISIEAIEFQSGAALTLTAAQFTGGLAPNATLSGTGSLIVNMGVAGSELYLQQLVTAGGTNVAITVNGSANDDTIKGALGSVNTINGGSGFDSIRGGQLADTLSGGDGDDKLEGGQGADILTGGAGADVFRYQSANASGLGAAADQITDFAIGTDKLGFQLIDADPVAAGDQAFGFLGTAAFTNTGVGQIRYQGSGANLLVQVDVDGNGIADMEIVLQGLGGQVLTSGDFLL